MLLIVITALPSGRAFTRVTLGSQWVESPVLTMTRLVSDILLFVRFIVSRAREARVVDADVIVPAIASIVT